MKRLHVVTWLVAAAFVAGCGSAGSPGGGSANSYSGKTIKLGAILSITGAGGVYGPQSRDGMNLAVKQIKLVLVTPSKIPVSALQILYHETIV